MIGGLGQTIHPVLAADFDGRAFGLCCHDRIEQVLLKPRLLKVDEGGEGVAFLGQKVEFIKQPVIVKDLAKVPAHPFVQHGGGGTQSVANLQRAFCKAQGTAAKPGPLVVVQKQHGNALLPKIQRRSQPDRAAAHHDDLVAHRRNRVLIGRATVRVKLKRQRIAIGHKCGHGVLP